MIEIRLACIQPIVNNDNIITFQHNQNSENGKPDTSNQGSGGRGGRR